MKKFKVVVNGEPFEVDVEEITGAMPQIDVRPTARPVPAAPKAAPPRPAPTVTAPPAATRLAAAPTAAKPAVTAKPGVVCALMPGSVIDIKVNAGEQVKTGDVIIILEAMKMENEITAPKDGMVKEIKVQKGQAVNTGDELIVIE
jgi:glutaconyl-CoA decarboxylase